MTLNKPIGGYFELELSDTGNQYHCTAIKMKCGRSALHYILTIIKPSLVYIPYYTCDSLVEPFTAGNFNYKFYSINEKLEPRELPVLKRGEYFLYVNYLGIKGATTAVLSEKYKDRLIIDATQAFFMKGDGVSWQFNSCRKFFGVPDGSYLYAPAGIKLLQPEMPNENYITTHLQKRRGGDFAEGYPYFLENEEMMDAQIAGMSELTEQLLLGVDYSMVIKKRLVNYDHLHDHFKGVNGYDAELAYGDIPMCYPLLPPHMVDRGELYPENIFIPTFWKEVLDRSPANYEVEKDITTRMLPLPIDHRYSTEDMKCLASSLDKILAAAK